MRLQSVPQTQGSSLLGKLALLFILIIWGAGAIGQVTFFSENVGTPLGTTSIGSYTGWQNGSPVIFSGTADVRLTSPSNTYTGFSAAGNVYFAATIGTNLVISGINSSIYTSITMSLGHYKSTTASSNELIIEVSSDGVTYLPLTYSRPTGSGTAAWLLVNPTGNIPSTPNLRIRFRQTSTASQFRIDDIKLTGNVNCPVQITSFAPSSGPAGTEVTILGSGFFGATGVFFNGIAASSFTVNSDINIKAIVPAGANSGNISVVNNCSSSSNSPFSIISTTCAFNGSNLILSELCIPNTNNGTDRYIEIFNPTNASVDLTGWIVNAISNGDISSSCLSWVLFGNILPGQALTCGYTNPVNGGLHDFPHPAWWATYPTNTNPNDCNYNWNGQQHDGASLYNGSTRIDGIFRSSLDNDWYNHKSLIRNPDICSPNSNSSYTEWTPSAIVPAAGTAPSTPRAHTANCVILQPAITQHPQSQTYCENQSGSLSVAASGGLQPYNYIWKVYTGSGTWQTVVNSSVYGGANTAALTFSSLPLNFDGYQYYCEIYNQDNSCYKASNAAIIHVSGSPILIVTNPPVACTPNTVNLTLPAVTAGSTLGSATLSYWQNSSCTVALPSPSVVSVSGTYYIKASAGSGCENIQPVTVTIGSSPVTASAVSSNPPTLCADDPGNIVLTAIGGSGTSIEWFDDVCGGNLIGTVNSLTIP
ncbi:MAG: lamin tail domain-containing protein, partial [Bacteroidales bacterium]